MPFDRFAPHPLTMADVRTYAPATSGVYGISNASEWIFIGAADNIQGALLEHLEDSGAAVMKKQPTGFVCEVCDAARRPARQGRLILEYEPACNQVPAHGKHRG
jgi:hypothetical protein